MKLRKILVLVLSIAMVIGLCACGSKKNEETESETETSTESESDTEETDAPKFKGNVEDLLPIGENTKLFGFKLFKDMHNDGENGLVSPVSVYIGYSMLYAGADNNSKEAMQSYFGYNEDTKKQTHIAGDFMNYLMDNEDGPTMKVANSMWISDLYGDDVKKEYVEEVENNLHSEANVRSFDNDTKDEINGWVDEKTGGLIKEIISEINPVAVMYLLNTVYFNGEWVMPFDEYYNYDDVFHGVDKDIDVTYLNTETEFLYHEDDEFQAVKLYYTGRENYMVVMLPKEGVTANPFDKFDDINDYMSYELVRLHLPKTDISCGGDGKFADALKNSELAPIFSDTNMDFTKILDSSVYVSDTIHKTALKITEAGTEAAAVTSIELAETMAMEDEDSPNPILMDVNRPYYCAIVNEPTGAVLFCGYVCNPTE